MIWPGSSNQTSLAAARRRKRDKLAAAREKADAEPRCACGRPAAHTGLCRGAHRVWQSGSAAVPPPDRAGRDPVFLELDRRIAEEDAELHRRRERFERMREQAAQEQAAAPPDAAREAGA